jgi:methylenetetrahydrofolate dehydrogenase (NADP+)/methenyltetrahydrofolate cyclohydrolase
MQLLDGKWLSRKIKEEIAMETKTFLDQGKRKPKLVAVLVGSDPASQFYIKSKMRACQKVGFDSEVIERDTDTTENEVLEIVNKLNQDESVDGYIVQLPLPAQIDENKVIEAVDPEKDVDGFHPVNIGKMAVGLGGYIPATPLGILKFFERYEIETEGKHAVVLGRSNIVGTPMSILLSRKTYPGNCTVTQVHSRSKNLVDMVRQADIIIAAIGKPNFVTADMVKEGAVIIDVGINRVEDPSREKGYRIVGDVDFEKVAGKASYITPVPGGVGLMTVTSLLLNTLASYKKSLSL